MEMKLLFKQRFFSWLNCYDVCDENNNAVFTVKAVLAFKHCFNIYDANGTEVGTIRGKALTFLRPRLDLFINGVESGSIVKEVSLFTPKYSLDLRNWQIQGNWLGQNYQIQSPDGVIAVIAKRSFTYEVEIYNPEYALDILMVVIAIAAV